MVAHVTACIATSAKILSVSEWSSQRCGQNIRMGTWCMNKVLSEPKDHAISLFRSPLDKSAHYQANGIDSSRLEINKKIGAAESQGDIVVARIAFAIIAAFVCLPLTPLQAQSSRPIGPLPSDCLSLFDNKRVAGLATWQSTVALEHCDRIKRLQRLSAMLPAEERPQFYESIIPRYRLPVDFGVDIPVLRVVFPDRVFFDTAKSSLRPEAQEIASIIAESLRREPPDVTLFVAGHADSRGDSDFNELLSISRADAVASTIFRYGINLGTVWRIGFGEDMPLVAGDNAEAWGQNRRIEFLFSARPEPIGVWLSDQQMPGLCQSRSSAESARCKANLQVRPGYEAARVQNVDPGTRKPVLPTRPRQRLAISEPETPKSDGTPSSTKKGVGPATLARAVVIPRNEPRIIINPVNKSAGAVNLRN